MSQGSLSQWLWAGQQGTIPIRAGISLFANVFILVLGPTQAPTQWCKAPYLEVKQQEHETDYLPLSINMVHNVWSYVSTLWCLIKNGANFIFKY
jgi:hypothetical protein